MSNRLPRARSLAVLVCLTGAVPVVATSTAATAAPTASAAATCGSLPNYPGVGYYLQLKATGLGCTSAKKVMTAHYRCRTKSSKTGTCKSVSGYKCTEKRTLSPENYDSKVTCKKGSKKVYYVYQQER
ncbi:MAG: hypothetical protein JWO02_410 [Solirubrobacterales bacterium]|nr:hypothetical protein [Solirubrobacterales bacterium]